MQAGRPTINKILAAQKMLDEQEVPKEGRVMRFVGKDGNEYEVSLDENAITPWSIVRQIPDWMIEK